jgi:hypothetical protein
MSLFSNFSTTAAAATLVAAALLVPTAPASVGRVGPVTNLTVTDKTASSVTLTWSAQSDATGLADYIFEYLPPQLTWQTFDH